MIHNIPESLIAQRELITDLTVRGVLERPTWPVRMLLWLLPVAVLAALIGVSVALAWLILALVRLYS